ncbi:MAG: acyl-CoA synthetase [Pseudomonadota bacterium]|nr:acyl-CoA synthetase [Pseudomonadota bacterium]
MLVEAPDYDNLRSCFRWQIPDRYNIARSTCDRWAETAPDKVAIIHERPDGVVEPWTYARLHGLANRLANVLRARGVEPGDRIALLLPQTPETAAVHLAAYKIAAIAVPLSILFGPEAIAYRLSDSGAKALVSTRQTLARLADERATFGDLDLVVSIDGPAEGAEDLETLCAQASDRFETADTGPDDPALMIYTSGTTGSPKGALHGHRVLLGHLPGVQMPHEFLPKPGDMLWTPADWAWAGGLLDVLLPGLHFGVPVVARRFDKFDPERAFAFMATHGVRNVFAPPTALRIMRAVERPRERYALALRTLASGGESLGGEVLVWGQEALGLTINEFYGQTECNLVLSSCGAIGVVRPGTIGKPVPGHEVAVIDAEGRPVRPGETGQIAVRRPDPVMFLEYWGRPEATQAKFIGDWMMTGDQGVMDEDGYIRFFGRDDDVITSAGYRIGPGEIEDCLIRHPAVSLAAAVGKPDPLRTEIVKAFVVLKPGFEPSDTLARDIQNFVRQRLSAHEYPREISFIDTMPLTSTGKVIRRLLRERA